MVWSAIGIISLFLALSGEGATPRSPEEHLGHPVGADFALVDWKEVSDYHHELAAASPRVDLRVLGSTEEGREFLLSLISSRENLERLDDIHQLNHRLSDPRGVSPAALEEALEHGRTILFISPGMHSTETSPAQFAMEFAYRLATSDAEPWRSAREELVVGLFPCTNPDGLDRVAHWYRRHVGTPYEATALDRLYQYYAGHDNNRDWFMLSLMETRLVTEQLYRVWRPQVYWDVHEQGSNRERFFVPPFRDPLNPNIDPAVIAGIDLLGTRGLMDMTRLGLSGISTGISYDMWWTGGNRNVPTRHNIVGLLTEAASVELATPVFLPREKLTAPRGLGAYRPSNRFPEPWPGGWWRLRQIIDYEMAFGESLLGSLAREPRLWRENSLELALRALARGRDEGPRGWLVPPDSNPDCAAVKRLLQVLFWTGVELHAARETFEVDGRPWPAGTILIRRDQPYGNHVKDLFELQRYPEGDSPYDVSGWTLPLLLGVHRVEVMDSLENIACETIRSPEAALVSFRGDPRITGDWLSSRNGNAWTTLIQGLADGRRYTWIGSGRRAGLFVPGEGVPDNSESPRSIEKLPRIGLYSPWRGHIPEGWMRWMLDHFEAPYRTVRNENLRAGALNQWLDVLILPGPSSRQLDRGRAEGTAPNELTGGLAPEGAVAIEEFVRGGGTLIAAGASSNWASELFRLPLADTTREESEFSCPGSVVRTVPESTPWTAGLPPSVAIFFSNSSAWRVLDEEEAGEADRDSSIPVQVQLRYAPRRVLLSGWMQGESAVQNRAAWVRADYGDGVVHLFGFRPQYRSWSQGAFHLLFRALFLR